MTIEAIPKAYRLWFDVEHAVVSFVRGLVCVQWGNFEAAHDYFVIAGVRCKPSRAPHIDSAIPRRAAQLDLFGGSP